MFIYAPVLLRECTDKYSYMYQFYCARLRTVQKIYESVVFLFKTGANEIKLVNNGIKVSMDKDKKGKKDITKYDCCFGK